MTATVERRHREMAFAAMGATAAAYPYVQTFLASGADPSNIYPIAAGIAQALAGIEAESRPRWVACAVKMPEQEVDVLFVDDGAVTVGCWTGSMWHGAEVSAPNSLVAHWMPLPPPPEGTL